MRAVRVAVQGFGPFRERVSIPLEPFTTIVGKNDVGKSFFLRALDLFLNDVQFPPELAHVPRIEGLDPYVELTFTEFPTALELESGVPTTLTEENLLDRDRLLTVRKTYSPPDPKKVEWSVATYDFDEDTFAALGVLKEEDLNQRGTAAGLTFPRSSPGNTNKSKREALRTVALQRGTPRSDRMVVLPARSQLITFLKSIFPAYTLFLAESSTDTSGSVFQAPFRPLIRAATCDTALVGPRTALETGVQTAVQAEVSDLFTEFQEYTDEFTGFQAQVAFSWDKAAVVSIQGTDRQGVTQPIDQRGSGFRRLLMVAMFRYLAKKAIGGAGNQVFAVEEPENSLHPGLQRDLVDSFRKLSRGGANQIIITSHSPVLAGAAEPNALVLITRSGGKSEAAFAGRLNVLEIAHELGVEPADQITMYRAIVFVEGPKDVDALNVISRTLREAGEIPASLEEAGVGVIPCGGDNLKHLVTRGMLQRLNRRFAVLIDSDRTSASASIGQSKLNWKQSCEAAGGLFVILRKRELENYLHQDAIVRGGGPAYQVDDFSDIKASCGENVSRYFAKMTAAELAARDEYIGPKGTAHELTEILSSFVGLPKPT